MLIKKIKKKKKSYAKSESFKGQLVNLLIYIRLKLVFPFYVFFKVN